jgi:predicted transcriptional regulator
MWFLDLLRSRQSRMIDVTSTILTRRPVMDEKVFNYIRANPGKVVADIAKATGMSQKAVHEYLSTAQGRSLVSQGLVAIENNGKELPPWSVDQYGDKLTCVPWGKREQELLVISQPPRSGCEVFDNLNAASYEIDNKLINTRGNKQKQEIARQKEHNEEQKSMAVARLNDRVDSSEEVLEALRSALAKSEKTIEANEEIIVLLKRENARLRDEIAALRDPKLRRAA